VPAPSDGAARTLRPAHPPARPLAGLLEHVPQLRADRPVGGVQLTGCTLDSRAVQPGDLYAALPGSRAHGADFAEAAASAGAVALLTDPAGAARCSSYDRPVVLADDPRGVLGQVARWVYDDPGRDLRLIGVTGTNGKTTTAFLLEAGLRAAGHRTGLLGTVLTRIGDDVVPSVRTTPEAPDLQALLAVMRERGPGRGRPRGEQPRLGARPGDGVVSGRRRVHQPLQDHLDFHATMEEYEAPRPRCSRPERARRRLNGRRPGRRGSPGAPRCDGTTFGEDAD
jgi:UDP-N-acetylmuramoyl-L-alanyl-D-glutamate--2,6-diaminopimelate ligase